ncbi:MAG: hypothetical protein ACRC3B_02570 [Bacteroidia bacterium]
MNQGLGEAIKTETALISYDPETRIVQMTAYPGTTFDATHAIDNRTAALELAGWERCGLIFESEGDIITTPAMRQVSASAQYNSHYIAVALVSPSVAMKILGNFYMRINRPVVPTRFFSQHNIAAEWLKQEITKDNLVTNSIQR